MSWKASAYVKELVVCPNGERISRTEKLVALVLADEHQDKAKAFTFPAVKSIAVDALMDPRHCRRVLDSLERKGVIRRDRPANQGRGQITYYAFPELDKPAEKGGEMSTFFKGKRGAEGGQKEDKTQGAYKEEHEHEQKQKATPLNPLASEGSVDVDSAAALEVNNETATAAGQEFDAEQLRHLDRMTDPDKRAGWEFHYREQNRIAAEQLRRDAAAAAEAAALERAIVDVPTARAWVMRRCGWVDRGRRRGLVEILEIVLAGELAVGNALTVAAPGMAKAWEQYTAAGEDLVVRYGPAKFFELGLWRGSARWHFDEKKIRMRAEAGIGSR